MSALYAGTLAAHRYVGGARGITPVAVEMLDGVMHRGVRESRVARTGVVPRSKIAATLRFIGEVARKRGLTISNIFHAGDGNMHPIILFNPRKPGDLEKARAAGEEILTYCIEAGGSITGIPDFRRRGMDAVITKPVSLPALLRQISSVLGDTRAVSV